MVVLVYVVMLVASPLPRVARVRHPLPRIELSGDKKDKR